MLEGTLPFDEKSTPALFNKIKKAEYSFAKPIPADAQDLVNRMIQPNTLRRMTIEEIKEHPWFTKDLDKYLFDFKFIHDEKYTKNINEKVLADLYRIKPDIRRLDEKVVRSSIINKDGHDFCGIYNELSHINHLSDVRGSLSQRAKDRSFKKYELTKEEIFEINQMNKRLNASPTIETAEKDEKEVCVEGENPRVSSYSSMQTNASLSQQQKEGFLDLISPADKIKEYKNGIIFKMSYQQVYELVFTTLKEMKMVWKRLNSDFVYKCQSGIPHSDQKKFKNTKYYQNFMQKKFIKFFIQFSAVDNRYISDEPEETSGEKEYL
jgi:serine/threonine protein kinase